MQGNVHLKCVRGPIPAVHKTAIVFTHDISQSEITKGQVKQTNEFLEKIVLNLCFWINVDAIFKHNKQ